MDQVKLAAHRGFKTDYPENTLTSFKEALKCDIDMVEIDLHMTKDGEIVMMHDHTVDRTTNGTGYVKDMTLDEIRNLDAGIKCGRQFKGEKVPTFREFLELMKDYPDIEVNVELKDYPDLRGDDAFVSADKSIAMLEEYGMADRIYINSWSGEVLVYISKKYNGKYRLHGYYPVFHNHGNFDVNDYYNRMYCVCLFNAWIDEDGKKVSGGDGDRVMEKEHFDLVKSWGVEPWVCFTPDTYPRVKQAVENGAVGITCNDPITAGILLDKVGGRKLKFIPEK